MVCVANLCRSACFAVCGAMQGSASVSYAVNIRSAWESEFV